MNFIIKKTDTPTEENVNSYIELIQTVWKNMEHTEWFAMDEINVIKQRFIDDTAAIYVVEDSSMTSDFATLAGLFMVTFPGLTEENLGWDLFFSEDELLQVAHMDSAVILPDYRGHGLQSRLMQMAEDDLRTQGYKYLLCTIHPENKFSLHNALKLGYNVEKTTLKYGGLPRSILMKTIIALAATCCPTVPTNPPW